MATNAAEIEFIPDEEIDFVPDEPIDFVPDQPVDVNQEAARSTAGALQAIDLATLPGKLDWSEAAADEVNTLREQAAAQFQARNAPAAQKLSSQAMRLDEKLQQEAPQSTGAQRLRGQYQNLPQPNVEGFQGANFLGRGLSQIAQTVGLTPLAHNIEQAGQSPIGLNFQANIGGAIGGAAGAAAMMVPGGQGLGASSLAPMLAPLAGGLFGGLAGGAGQEVIQRATETPEETGARHEALAETERESPFASALGRAVTNAPFMRPSLSVISEAMAGNKTAQAAVAAAGGIGAAMGAGGALLQGQKPSLAGIAESALSNLIFNKPTRLGRALGLPAVETGRVEEQTGFEPITIEPDAQQISETSPPDGGVRAPEVPIADAIMPTNESGTGVQPSGQGEPLVETAPETPREVAPIQQIRPAIKVGDQTIVGESGQTHREILNDYLSDHPDEAPDALMNFDTKENPNIFVGPEGELSRTELKEKFGVSDSQGLAELQKQFPPAQTGENPTGIRNAIVDPARAEAGIPPREIPLARSFPQIHEEARAALANDPEAGRRLVSELGKEIRPLTDTEDAVLTFEQNSREQERTAAVDAVNNAPEGEARDAAIARLSAADDALFEVYQVGQQAGTANARGLNARRLMQNKDFTLSKMLNEHRAIVNDGQPNTPKQTEEITKLYERIAELEGKVAGNEAKAAKSEAQAEYQRILRETKKEASEASKAKRSPLDFIEEAEKKAMDRIVKRRGRLQVTVDPLNIAGLVDEAIIGAAHVARGVRDFAQWSKKMLDLFGERVRPHLDSLFAKSTSLADDTIKTFEKNAPKTPESILNGIKEGAKLEQRVVYDLARAHVNAGVESFEQVIANTTKDLQGRFPGIDESKVMRTLSDYGKTTTPSKEADLVKMREYRNLARLHSQLEDLQKGLPALKTGAQRDKATAQIRELQRKVNEASRAAGFNKVSSESQLATAHTARVTRLKNSIEDTNRAIAAGKRPDKPNPVPWTPEETALRDQLNELNTRLDDVLNEPDSAKLQGLLRRIEDVQGRIKSGEIGTRPRKQGPETKEVAQAKDDLAKLNKELADMRKAQRDRENPPKSADEKKLAALEKQRESLFERVSKGDTSTRTGKPTADTAEQAKVRAEIAELNKQMSDLRKAEKSGKPADEATFKSLQKRLTAAQAKLASGDVTPKPRGTPTVDTARVAQARTELEVVNKQINELRSNSEELRLNRDKARIQTQIRELEERISRGDYEPKTRREPALDREKIDLQHELSKAKEKWNIGLIEAKRAKRPLGQKIFEGIGEGINLARQLVTSGDFPPVFRQGLFAIGRPITMAKATIDSFKAMVSEKQRFRIMQEIENRPNAPLYSRSKLYLAKDTAQPLSQMEENFMGNWFKQLPRWTIVGPLLRASERSYNTFLNKLRADTFDSAVKMFNISETDTASLKALAANVNTFTGRSTLPGRALEQGAPALNTLLFAPRFMMSRFKIAAGQPLWGGTAKSRLAALDTYARTLGGVALMYGLAKMGGAEIETDPRSSDFGKIKMGQTRLDPLGGLSQITTFLTRVITGETKTGKGKLVPLREGMRPLEGTSVGAKGKPNMIVGGTGDVLKNFLRSKLNPAAGTVWNMIEGKDITGKPVTPASTLVNTTIPISYQDILSTMEKQGIPRGAALFTLSLFGMGLNTYEDRKK